MLIIMWWEMQENMTKCNHTMQHRMHILFALQENFLSHSTSTQKAIAAYRAADFTTQDHSPPCQLYRCCSLLSAVNVCNWQGWDSLVSE